MPTHQLDPIEVLAMRTKISDTGERQMRWFTIRKKGVSAGWVTINAEKES